MCGSRRASIIRIGRSEEERESIWVGTWRAMFRRKSMGGEFQTGTGRRIIK